MLLMTAKKNSSSPRVIAKILFVFLGIGFLLIFPTGFMKIAMFLLFQHHFMLMIMLIAPFCLFALSLLVILLLRHDKGRLFNPFLMIYRISWLTLFCMLLSFLSLSFLYMIYGMGDGYILLLIPKLINNSLLVIIGTTAIQHYRPHLPMIARALLLLLGYGIYPIVILPLA